MQPVYFTYNILLLKSMAMYQVDINWNVFKRFGYYLLRFLWLYCVATTVLYSALDIYLKDSFEVTDIALNIITLELYLSILLRYLVFISNSGSAARILEKVSQKFRFHSEFSLESVTMESAKKIHERFFLIWSSFVIGAGMFMATAPLLQSERNLALPIWTFYDWSESPYYEITITIQMITQMFMVLAYSNLEMLNVCFKLLATHQLAILGANFGNIFNNALMNAGFTKDQIYDYIDYEHTDLKLDTKIEQVVNTKTFDKSLIENLHECIKHHQDILEILRDYQKLISPLLLIETFFVFCYVIFILFAFITTETDISMYLALSQYLVGSIAQIFMMTYFGERLTAQAEDVKFSLYNIPWYLCSKRFLTDFKIVQMRMRVPVRIAAGKVFPMALESFLEFMKKAFSFFTVLRQANQ